MIIILIVIFKIFVIIKVLILCGNLLILFFHSERKIRNYSDIIFQNVALFSKLLNLQYHLDLNILLFCLTTSFNKIYFEVDVEISLRNFFKPLNKLFKLN
jgi:hypothetical protein